MIIESRSSTLLTYHTLRLSQELSVECSICVDSGVQNCSEQNMSIYAPFQYVLVDGEVH